MFFNVSRRNRASWWFVSRLLLLSLTVTVIRATGHDMHPQGYSGTHYACRPVRAAFADCFNRCFLFCPEAIVSSSFLGFQSSVWFVSSRHLVGFPVTGLVWVLFSGLWTGPGLGFEFWFGAGHGKAWPNFFPLVSLPSSPLANLRSFRFPLSTFFFVGLQFSVELAIHFSGLFLVSGLVCADAGCEKVRSTQKLEALTQWNKDDAKILCSVVFCSGNILGSQESIFCHVQRLCKFPFPVWHMSRNGILHLSVSVYDSEYYACSLHQWKQETSALAILLSKPTVWYCLASASGWGCKCESRTYP